MRSHFRLKCREYLMIERAPHVRLIEHEDRVRPRFFRRQIRRSQQCKQPDNQSPESHDERTGLDSILRKLTYFTKSNLLYENHLEFFSQFICTQQYITSQGILRHRLCARASSRAEFAPRYIVRWNNDP